MALRSIKTLRLLATAAAWLFGPGTGAVDAQVVGRGIVNQPRTSSQVMNSQSVTRAFVPLSPDTAGLLPAPIFPRKGLERTIHVPLPLNPSEANSGTQQRSLAMDYDPAKLRGYFQGADRDGDGYLTLREAFQAFQLAPDAFERADANGDRLLSFAEFDERVRTSLTWGGMFIDTKKFAPETLAAANAPNDPNAATNAADGFSFEAVARERVRARVAMADANADGILDREELAQFLPSVAPRWNPISFLNRYDVDGNTGIDVEELYQAVLDLRASGDPDIGRKAEQLAQQLSELRDDAPMRAGTLIRAFDRDRNLKVDPLEMEAALASLDTPLRSAQLLMLDADADLSINHAEFERALSAPDTAVLLAPLADFLAEHFPLACVPTPLHKLDSDGDDRISRSELEFWLSKHPNAVPAAAVLTKFDRDRDGSLDLLEFLRVLGREPATGPATTAHSATRAPLPESLRLLDQDDSSTLSYREIEAVFEAQLGVPGQGAKIFARCDRNADGELDAEELLLIFGAEVPKADDAAGTTAAPGTEEAARDRVLDVHDTDRDGGLGLQEMEAWAHRRALLISLPWLLRQADRDQNGTLLEAELDAALAAAEGDAKVLDVQAAGLEAQARIPLALGLQALDTNADRRISPHELGAALGAEAHKQIRALFRAYDGDASGYFEAAELRWLGLR